MEYRIWTTSHYIRIRRGSVVWEKGKVDIKSSWSEDYQTQLYLDNLKMFSHIPNLRGISPWILFDFRSPFRFHPNQGGEWNRKGLVSDQGYRKKLGISYEIITVVLIRISERLIK